MSFLKDLFSKGEPPNNAVGDPIMNYADFWRWFARNEKTFHGVVKNRDDVEKKLFDEISPKLLQLHEGMFLLAGMCEPEIAELIITPDGNIKNIVFAEEIVAAAPKFPGWRLTALKPPSGEDFELRKGEISIGTSNLKFIANESWERPDEVDIAVVYDGLTEENREEVSHAAYLFLDNYLGELEFAIGIDEFEVIGPLETSGKARPIEELKTYLAERQKAFREKYEGQRINTDEDEHAIIEGELRSGLPLIAVVNTVLLKWDRKASHPWVAGIDFAYKDSGNNGMPSNEDYELLSRIEDEIMVELKDSGGYLNVGRETCDNRRTVFFACREFRKPSKVFYEVKSRYSGDFEIGFDIYKDKYWRTFDRFLQTDDSPEFTN